MAIIKKCYLVPECIYNQSINKLGNYIGSNFIHTTSDLTFKKANAYRIIDKKGRFLI